MAGHLSVVGPCLSVSWPRVPRQRMLTSGTSTIHILSGGLVSTAGSVPFGVGPVWNLEADGVGVGTLLGPEGSNHRPGRESGWGLPLWSGLSLPRTAAGG